MKEVISLLHQTERRLLDHARQLRLARKELTRELNSKGVLGSRGLTQFILEHLERTSPQRTRVADLQRIAQAAGYAVPGGAALTQRLSEFRARTGKVDQIRGEGWGWVGQVEVEEGEGKV